jgi:hypothetical protein
MARENALYIITAFCHQIKLMEFTFGSLSLINFDLFAEKFGDKIKEIKIICHKHNNECNCCNYILQFFNSKCNKKCNVKLVYKSLSQD